MIHSHRGLLRLAMFGAAAAILLNAADAQAQTSRSRTASRDRFVNLITSPLQAPTLNTSAVGSASTYARTGTAAATILRRTNSPNQPISTSTLVPLGVSAATARRQLVTSGFNPVVAGGAGGNGFGVFQDGGGGDPTPSPSE